MQGGAASRLFAFLLLAGAAWPAQVEVTVLATTDLHGNIYPVDYVSGRPAARGLAKIATLAGAVRASNPNTLLIDCGDTIQGTPLEYVYQSFVRTGAFPLGLQPARPLRADPMMLAMNRLGYDAMTVGNHEFNFGLKALDRARGDAKFPWLSANTVVAPGARERPFQAYVVRNAGPVKVAIIGITTPAVPTWEKPENLGGYRFEAPVDAVRKAVAELRAHEKPDLIVVAAHSGLGIDPVTKREQEPAENVVLDLARKIPELDAIVFGHTHMQFQGRPAGDVLLVQPKNGGAELARLDFTLESKPGGGWKVVSKTARMLPVTAATVPDPDILALAKPYEDVAQAWLNTPVAESPRAMDAALGRVEDTALVDAIQRVQLYYSKADVSFTALFNPALRMPAGRVTVRQIAALYPYDNELYVIDGSGRMVKDALENAARYYLSCEGARCGQPPLVNREVVGFNYDMAEGVEYEIDLGRPPGDRIRNLRRHGQPLAPGERLRIAINNYRAAGSAGYSMFVGAPVVWRSGEEIRDLIVRYYGEQGRLPAEATGNWRLLPEEARRTLEKQALAEATRRERY